ncbi:hypothetical protein [Streptomyces sp. MK37H]|uniref:hypothetical protein n=1 Tax=Streptomyces sp. MK37H TaxID=2699117 RepID=UPI001B385B74|nr:hypothetical protein [Streptomyces sp. MK37H]
MAVVGFTGDAALAAGDRFDVVGPGRPDGLGGAVTAALKEVRSGRCAIVGALLPAISREEPERLGVGGAG